MTVTIGLSLAALANTTQNTTATPAFDPSIILQYFLQYGLIGIVVLCFILRKFIVPEWSLKEAEIRAAEREKDLSRRLDETKEQLDRLQDVFQGQMIPALTRATEIAARYNEELQRARFSRGNRDNPSPSDPLE